jgi:hypothetical protein
MSKKIFLAHQVLFMQRSKNLCSIKKDVYLRKKNSWLLSFVKLADRWGMASAGISYLLPSTF